MIKLEKKLEIYHILNEIKNLTEYDVHEKFFKWEYDSNKEIYTISFTKDELLNSILEMKESNIKHIFKWEDKFNLWKTIFSYFVEEWKKINKENFIEILKELVRSNWKDFDISMDHFFIQETIKLINKDRKNFEKPYWWTIKYWCYDFVNFEWKKINFKFIINKDTYNTIYKAFTERENLDVDLLIKDEKFLYKLNTEHLEIFKSSFLYDKNLCPFETHFLAHRLRFLEYFLRVGFIEFAWKEPEII